MNTNEGHNDAASREPIVTLLFSRDDVDGVEEVRLAVLVRCIAHSSASQTSALLRPIQRKKLAKIGVEELAAKK